MYEMYRRSLDLRDAIEHDVRRLLDPELSTEEKEKIVRILWTMRETSERMDETIDSISQQNGL